MEYYEPMCPECALELTVDDCYDLCDIGTMLIYVKASGHCDCCGRNYTWSDVYKYNRFEDLTEVK